MSLRRLFACMLAGVVALACAPPDEADSGGGVQVVATTGMIGDVAKRVGGEHVRVTTLMGPGVDPHLYKASEGDVRRLFRADVILYNGLHLESRMGEVLEAMDGRARVAAVAEAIPQGRLLAPPEFSGAYDPHVWFDVGLWSLTVDRVRDALIAADPAHAPTYLANADSLRSELADLDAYARFQAQRVPPELRVLVTAHDAFNYFGRAYGFQVRGLQGISTATEAGTADVQELAEFIARRRIPAVFIESSIPRRTVEAVQAAVRARGWNVEIGGELFSDAMGNPGTPEGTYPGMVRHNIDTIVRALLRQST